MERGYRGGASNEMLRRIRNGWLPPVPRTLPGGKRAYVRPLFYEYGWTRSQLIAVFQTTPGMIARYLCTPWAGMEDTPEPTAPTVVDEGPWKSAYESAVRRAEAWEAKWRADHEVLDAVSEFAERLSHSHPARAEKVRLIGDQLLDIVRKDGDPR
ncbi:hypothetical protein [Rhodococcus sp. 11-3]|uniref:hypothetical protein n=1 Tax=Rhodococcus sp. 11-3 TaxID=2854796 RepID=UPI00203F1325|nr:hypothetical protein [Rhodococcus sp. 11-3]USC16991.1 hypothetical protein KZJ41_09050 [Rhodococcus sp. 11-3]